MSTSSNSKILQTIKNYLPDVVVGIIVALICTVIRETLKRFNKIYDWLIMHKTFILPFILIVANVALIIITIISQRNRGMKKGKQTVISLFLVFCSAILLFAGLSIALTKSPSTEMIYSWEISPENLRKQRTMPIQIKKPYRKLALVIEGAEENGFMLPEIELEKLSPLKGDWVSRLEEWSAEKLTIPELDPAKKDERFYRLKNGSYKVQEIGEKDVFLNEQNQIRINVRNFAELQDPVTLELWGTKNQGAKR